MQWQAKDYISKAENQNKAVEFRLESGESKVWSCQHVILGLGLVNFVCIAPKVVLEEQGTQGASDGPPSSLFTLIVQLEKRGLLDLKLTGHKIDRPPDVKRGESADRIDVIHETYSVFKPGQVALKTAKQTNLAGLIGYKALSSSQYLTLVWRYLDARLYILLLCWLDWGLFVMMNKESLEKQRHATLRTGQSPGTSEAALVHQRRRVSYGTWHALSDRLR